MGVIRYGNLTNGLLYVNRFFDSVDGLVRIQSTSLEQKMFGRVIEDLPLDFLAHLYGGAEVLVLDATVPQHKEHGPRAIWQGLPWIRYVLERRWFGVERTAPTVKGWDTSRYFDQQYRELLNGELRNVDYFCRFGPPNEPLKLAGRYLTVEHEPDHAHARQLVHTFSREVTG